jgi:hypothetical protein
MKNVGRAVVGLGAAALVAGCSPGVPFDDPFAEYGQRIMTVSPTAGNAEAANTAIQTVDPWPRYVNNTNIPGDGARMVSAVDSYEGVNGKTVAPPPAIGGSK